VCCDDRLFFCFSHGHFWEGGGGDDRGGWGGVSGDDGSVAGLCCRDVAYVLNPHRAHAVRESRKASCIACPSSIGPFLRCCDVVGGGDVVVHGGGALGFFSAGNVINVHRRFVRRRRRRHHGFGIHALNAWLGRWRWRISVRLFDDIHARQHALDFRHERFPPQPHEIRAGTNLVQNEEFRSQFVFNRKHAPRNFAHELRVQLGEGRLCDVQVQYVLTGRGRDQCIHRFFNALYCTQFVQ